MSLPRKVRLFEVGPRDGLQNEKAIVPVEVKVGLIDRLTDAGLPVIEATSFVSPKWVPQLADAAEVLARIQRKPGVSYPVLVPNRKGLDAAIAAGCDEIVIFGAATETFSKRNTNCTIAEGLARFSEVCAEALKHGIRVRGDVSVCLGCPYEGDVSPGAGERGRARACTRMGCYEICIADTIGIGTPGKTRAVVEAVARHVPMEKLAGHFHDTYGQALANTLRRAGMRRGGVRQLGGRARRLPLCEGRDRQRRDRGLALHAAGPGYRDRRRHDEAHRGRTVHLRPPRPAHRLARCARAHGQGGLISR